MRALPCGSRGSTGVRPAVGQGLERTGVDALLEHFTDDVVFTSPVAVRIFGGDGMIRGKEALRKYWSEGVRLIPDLHFEVLALYVGISTLVINYRNQAGGVVSEVLTFEGSLVREGHGTYLAQALTGLE
jgi:ketosteroid isomerase-like protein